MELSMMDESTFNMDMSLHQSTRRKLDDDFGEIDNEVSKEKKPRLDDTHMANKEHMGVYLRVRPFTEKETQNEENQGCMEIENHHLLIARAPAGSNTFKNSQHGCGKQTHRFTFSKIFEETTSQKEFFDNTVLDKVKDFIEGQNSLIFTYGVTNSGKTFTIQGHAKDGGILPRSLDVLFNSIGGRQLQRLEFKPSMFCDVVQLSEAEQENDRHVKQRVMEMAVRDEESDVTVSSMVGDSDSSRLTTGSRMSEDSLNIDSGHGSEHAEGSDKSAIDQLFKEAEERVREEGAVNVNSETKCHFSVWVTFVEIYNEYIYDLLEPIPKKKTIRRPTVTLREDKSGIPYVKGVKQIPVTTADEAYKILVIGKQNLQMACTKLNHNSSRSHCIFTIKLIRITDQDNQHSARVNMLSFCDLAGAERYSKTLAGGDRMKEAGNINTSLLSLGRCIKILRHNQHSKEHQQMVPFRDSKLTRIFQSALTGKGKASMIVNINQCASTFDETLHALKYSAIAKQVVNVQDPPKEPEQKLEPVARSSRYVSLLLAQAQADPRGPRPTIGFGTPGTLARILQEEEDEMPTPKADSEDDQETILMEIIDTLKTELVKERNEKNMMEWNIRNEILMEVQEQMQEQEQHYEERINELRDRMEDRADSKVNLLLQSMKKKKQRKDKDEDEEVDQTDLMRAAIEAKDSQIEMLEDRIKCLEDELESLGQQPKKTPPREEATKVETPSTKKDQMDVIQQLQDKLQDTKSQLSAKEVEVGELGEMLTEAGETFEQKAAEIEKLEKELEAFRKKSKEQEARLDDMTQLLEKANKSKADSKAQCRDLDKKVSLLTAQLEAANAKDCDSCQEQVVQLGELVSKLADTEAEVDKINTDFVRLQTEGQAKDSKVEELLAQLEVLQKDLTGAKEAKKEYKRQLQKNSSNPELQGKVEKLQEIIDKHQGVLRDHEAFVADLNKQLKEAKQNLELMTLEHTESSRKFTELSEKNKKEEDEFFKAQEQLTVLEEERDELRENLEAREKKMLEDGRHSLQLENKVAGLEQSLQQANSCLRETALEAAQTKEMLEELTTAKQALDTKHSECKPRITDLNTQLEDYIVRVNEQVEDIESMKEKFTAEEQKASNLQLKMTEAEGKLLEQDGELKNLLNKVTDLEARLKAERKQQKSAGSELDELLQSKAITIEELNTNVSQLKNKLNQKQNEAKSHKEKTEQLEQKIEQLTEELKSLRSQLSAARVTETEMKDEAETAKLEQGQSKEKISRFDKEMEKLQKNELHLQEELEAAKNKINSLQVSLEMSAETGEELIEVRSTVEDLTKKLAAAEATVQELQPKDEVHSDKQDGKTSDEEVEKFEKEIRQLKNEVSEAQYGAQMNSRTLRREKSQVERKLKETEEELNELRSNMLKLQSTIATGKIAKKSSSEEDSEEDGDPSKDLKKQLQEQSKKAKRLEDIVQDLEDCLRCAKGSQQAAEDSLEAYKQKCRALEDEVGIKEDDLHSMEGRLSELDVRTQDLASKKEEIDRLNDSVCELEHKCKEYRSGMEQLEARLSYIGMLEEKNESILSELDEHDRKVQDLNMMVDEAEKKISHLEKDVASQKEKLSEEQAIRKEHEETISANKATISELESKVGKLSVEIEKLTESLQEKSKEFDNMKNENATIQEELRSKAGLQKETEDSSQSRIAELEKIVEEKTSALTSVETLRVESENTVMGTLQEKESVIEDLKTEMKKLKDEESKNNSTLQAKLDEINELKQTLGHKEAGLQKSKVDLETLEAEKSSVALLLTSQEANVESFKTQVSSLKDEVHSLIRKLEKLTKDKEETSVTIKSLRLEVDVKNAKITELDDTVKQAKENVTNPEDLEKARKREKELRTQLSEASSRQEEQNKKFNALEDQLREAREAAEKQEDTRKSHREALSKLREELRSVRQELTSAHEEQEHTQRRLNTENTSLSSKLKNLEEDIEKKETKLKSRSGTISELMSKIEHERNGFEISLQDARANEAVLGQLKQALEDQDATIELQEKALSQKEEEIAALQKEHEEFVEKYNTTLKDTSSQSSNVRDLTKQLQKLREDRKEAERVAAEAEEKLREARAAVGRSDKEKVQFKRDMEDTNRELQAMEKILSDTRREVDQLKSRLAEMRPKSETVETHSNQDAQKLALLKTKFVALESTNEQLQLKVQELQKDVTEVEENKKSELETWRQERDKFVGQLEKILKQKEAELSEMKKRLTKTPKTDHELQNRIDKLELEVSDKDAIIDELSRHLDQTDNQKTRGRRNTRHSNSDDTPTAMRKELDDLRKQYEAERQSQSRDMARVVKAKDEVINDLRHTNLTLQSRLPGATQVLSTVPEVQIEVEERSSTENKEPPQEKSPRKAPQRKRGRPNKRKTSESEAGETSKTPKRKSTRRTEAQITEAQLQVSFDENQEEMVGTQDDLEEVVGLLVETPAKRTALTDTLNTSVALAKFVSPIAKSARKLDEPQSERSRRRVKLRGTVAEPFTDSPPTTPADTPSKDKSHEIVTRQLRTRRKCTNV